jgi:hypothetical protein
MKKLFKVRTILVDGWGEGGSESLSYMISDLDHIEDDEEVTQDDVIEADVVFLEYNKYELVGDISDSEIEVLTKFGILK